MRSRQLPGLNGRPPLAPQRRRSAGGVPASICDDRLVTATSRSRPPSVERLLAVARQRAGERAHEALVAAAREAIEEERDRLAVGRAARSPGDLADAVIARLDGFVAGARPTRVVNATGVIVHTNLGRAPWPEAAIRAAEAAAREPLFLELDRATGRRGPRYRAAEEHLVALTGAEDALVVNNCAAALVLAVGLAGRKGVVVGRGELVEIGGGVRIPEIVRRAGARLVEVGTTNRTRVEDYEAPLREGRAAMVLRVHPSNFTMAGFTESPDPAALAALAHAHGALVVDDLGSGALLDTSAFGLAHEPTPAERLAAGADLVAFSGDKLVGGPAGRAARRAGRPRRPSPEGSAGTGDAPGQGDPRRRRRHPGPVPGRPGHDRDPGLADDRHAGRRHCGTRADALAGRIPGAALVALDATVGGGSLPGETLPSFGLALAARSADRLLAALRAGEPAVVGRIGGRPGRPRPADGRPGVGRRARRALAAALVGAERR